MNFSCLKKHNVIAKEFWKCGHFSILPNENFYLVPNKILYFLVKCPMEKYEPLGVLQGVFLMVDYICLSSGLSFLVLSKNDTTTFYD